MLIKVFKTLHCAPSGATCLALRTRRMFELASLTRLDFDLSKRAYFTSKIDPNEESALLIAISHFKKEVKQ